MVRSRLIFGGADNAITALFFKVFSCLNIIICGCATVQRTLQLGFMSATKFSRLPVLGTRKKRGVTYFK